MVFMICHAACDHLCPCRSFLNNSFFSCKDRALERDRPYQRKKTNKLIFGRLVVGRACPCPRFVGWFASVCGLVALFLVCLVLSCGCPPLWPLLWRLVDQWFRGLPSFVSVWILVLRQSRYDLLSATDWSGDGVCPFPFVIVLYGNKLLSPWEPPCSWPFQPPWEPLSSWSPWVKKCPRSFWEKLLV